MSVLIRRSTEVIEHLSASTWVVFSFLLLCLSSAPTPTLAQAFDKPLELSIPAGDLADALNRLSDQSGIQIMYQPEEAKGIKVGALNGAFTVDDALNQLLAQTGLKASRVNDKTVVLKRVEDKSGSGKKGQAAAQEKSPGVSQDDMEELVVTARKVTETVMEAPYSVSAISGKALENFDIVTIEDAAHLAPSLYITGVNSVAQVIAIRGVATIGNNAAFEQSVGLNLDGLAFGRSRWIEVGQFDVQQFEVLRGPQSLYFGKNTTAGIVSFDSKGPGNTFEAQVKTSYETATREKLVDGFVSGPITDSLGARVAVQIRDSDGYIHDLVTKDDVPRARDMLGRLTLSWRPSDNSELDFKSFYAHEREYGSAGQLYQCAPGLLALLAARDSRDNCHLDDYSAVAPLSIATYLTSTSPNSDQPINFNDSSYQVLSGKLDLGNVELKSITGYTKSKVTYHNNAGGFDLGYAEGSFPENDSHFSQELRLNTNVGSRLSLMLGAYYDHEHLLYTTAGFVDLNSLGLPVAGAFWDTRDETAQSWALFTEAGFSVTDSLRLLAGGRYTDLTKDDGLNQAVGPLSNPFQPDPATTAVIGLIGRTPINLTGSLTSAHFDPSIVAQWDFLQDLPITGLDAGQIYASYKEGFKAGGFDLISSQTPPLVGTPDQNFKFGDETVKAYELGTKYSALDRKVQGSLALFTANYSNLQVSAYPNTTSIVVQTFNAASSTVKGFETELNVRATEQLTFSGSFSYSHGRYNSFPLGPCYPGQSPAQGCIDGHRNLAGQPLPGAPERTANVGFNWQQPVFAGLQVRFGSNASFASSIPSNNDPNAVVPGQWKVDAYAALGGTHWELALAGRNLSDQRLTGIGPVTLFNGSYDALLGPPRQFYLTLTLRN